MKKLAILSALVMAVFTFSSCEKAEKLFFQPFESPLNFDVTIAQVNSTNVESSLGSTTVNFDLDKEVEDNTDGMLDGSVVGAMYINQIAITLTDFNGTNNLQNFEYVTLSVSSGSSAPTVFGPFTIPAGAVSNAVFTVSNSANIRQYFNGANVNFTLSGKAKTATNRTLPARIGATIKFDK